MEFLDSMRALLRLHAERGQSFPAFLRIESRAVPAPWAALLVHDRSMTATLAEHYGDDVTVRLLGDDILTPDKALDRVVVLGLENADRPVALADYAFIWSGSRRNCAPRSSRPSVHLAGFCAKRACRSPRSRNIS